MSAHTGAVAQKAAPVPKVAAPGAAPQTVYRMLLPPKLISPEVPDTFEQRFAAMRDSGQPLPAAERAFFEPRFGRDLADVRLHSGPAASALARSVGARAFTLGNAIVVGAGQYAPGTREGRRLIAHELTHVVQQGSANEARTIRRTIHPSCAGRESLLNEAWAEGLRMVGETVAILEGMRLGMRHGYDPAELTPSIVAALRGIFGDLGFVPGGITQLPDLIRQYRLIEAGFRAGRMLRCDPDQARPEANECERFEAFVIPGNTTDVFACPTFFYPDRTAVGRGISLVHEMAHSVLGIEHQGGLFVTLGCGTTGLTYDDARHNAYAYHMLVSCLAGQPSAEATNVRTRRPAAAPPARAPVPAGVDRRWSLSASAGAELGPAAQRFAAMLGTRYSIRAGQLVVFNPVIGLNVFYLPPGAPREHVVAATIDAGLRIQQPLRGVYVDVTGGAMTGFTINTTGAARPTAGVTATAGAGWRSERIELGAEARGMLPLTAGDSGSILVLGRFAVRFGAQQ